MQLNWDYFKWEPLYSIGEMSHSNQAKVLYEFILRNIDFIFYGEQQTEWGWFKNGQKNI